MDAILPTPADWSRIQDSVHDFERRGGKLGFGPRTANNVSLLGRAAGTGAGIFFGILYADWYAGITINLLPSDCRGDLTGAAALDAFVLPNHALYTMPPPTFLPKFVDDLESNGLTIVPYAYGTDKKPYTIGSPRLVTRWVKIIEEAFSGSGSDEPGAACVNDGRLCLTWFIDFGTFFGTRQNEKVGYLCIPPGVNPTDCNDGYGGGGGGGRADSAPSGPSDYAPTGPSDYPPTGPSDYPPAGPSDYPPTGPSDYAPTGPSDYAPTGPSDYAPTGPSDYNPPGPSDYAPTGPSDYAPTGPSDYAPTGPSDYNPPGPSDYAPTGPSDYPPSGPSAYPCNGTNCCYWLWESVYDPLTLTWSTPTQIGYAFGNGPECVPDDWFVYDAHCTYHRTTFARCGADFTDCGTGPGPGEADVPDAPQFTPAECSNVCDYGAAQPTCIVQGYYDGFFAVNPAAPDADPPEDYPVWPGTFEWIAANNRYQTSSTGTFQAISGKVLTFTSYIKVVGGDYELHLVTPGGYNIWTGTKTADGSVCGTYTRTGGYDTHPTVVILG